MHRRCSIILPVFLLLLVVFGTGPSHCTELIRIGGSGSGLTLVKQLGDAFMKQHPDVQVKLVSNLGSTGGIKAVSEGALDIAVSSRPPKSTEIGVETTRIARTPLVFATHASVTRKNITIAELEQIYAGIMTSWPDGSRLRLILRPERETDTQILRAVSPALDRAITVALAKRGMLLAINDQDNLRMLERTPGSLGAITLAMVCVERPSLNVLSFNDIKPTAKSVATGHYPLTREIHLVTKAGTASKTVRAFTSFVLSPAARPLLDKAQCLAGP